MFLLLEIITLKLCKNVLKFCTIVHVLKIG